MSKFLLTNSEEMHSCAKKQLQHSQFKLGFDFSGESIYALTTTKLLIDNNNFYQIDGNFVLSNGTLLYDNRIGADMHSKLLASYDGTIENLRDNCYGIYAVGLYKEKKLTVYSDKSSIYDVFYYIGDGVWAISSSLSLLVQLLKEKLSINKLNLMESLARYCILGGETIFNEIKRLEGHQILHASFGNLSIDDCHRIKFESFDNDEEAIREAADTMKKIARSFSDCYGKPAISMTGGLDSRMVLASYLSADVKPDIVYGLGNSKIIKSSTEDARIVQEYSGKFGLESDILPLNDTLPIDKLWDELIVEFEDDALFTRGNKDIIDYFARFPYSFFEIGKFGEFYRDAGWEIIKEGEYATISDVAEKWYFKSLDGNIFETHPILREHLLLKLKKCADKYDINPNRIERRDLQKFALEYYSLTTGSSSNFVNRFKYCHNLLAEAEIISKLQYAEVKDSSLVLRLLNALYPAVLDVPIYSHWRYLRYDKKNMKLKLDLTKSKGLFLKLIPPRMLNRFKRVISYQKMPSYISCLYSNDKYKQILRKWLPEDAVTALLSGNDNRASFVVGLIMRDRLFAHWGLSVE